MIQVRVPHERQGMGTLVMCLTQQKQLYIKILQSANLLTLIPSRMDDRLTLQAPTSYFLPKFSTALSVSL